MKPVLSYNLEQSLLAKIKKQVSLALIEDISDIDLSASIISNNSIIQAKIISRQQAVLCGSDWVNEVFNQLDSKVNLNWNVNDGESVAKNQILCELTGPCKSLLTGERVALNFMQLLSAVSTVANKFVNLVADTKVKILATRKTIPNLRLAQHYAVLCGGGDSHRLGLYDQLLLKENHINVSSLSLRDLVNSARCIYPDKFLVVEVENITQLSEIIDTDVNRIILDNFEIDQIKQAVKLTEKAKSLEISGNIDEHNIINIAKTGIDYISIGKLTKDIIAVDFSLLFV